MTLIPCRKPPCPPRSGYARRPRGHDGNRRPKRLTLDGRGSYCGQGSYPLVRGLEILPHQREERSLAVDGAEPTEARTEEVLVLDSSTSIQEAGLTSRGASALKHYLYHRRMKLVVPQVVAEECERRLTDIVRGKKEKIEEWLKWLGRFFGEVNGWQGPNDDAIEKHAKLLANAEHLGAIVLPEPEIIRKRAEARNQAERPPSHKRLCLRRPRRRKGIGIEQWMPTHSDGRCQANVFHDRPSRCPRSPA